MKVRQTKMALKIKYIISVIVVIVVAVGVGVWLSGEILSKKSQTVSTESIESKSTEPAPVKDHTIKLTDGIKVTAAPGDYLADDHIWRLVNKTHPFNDQQYRPSALEYFELDSLASKSKDERSIRSDTAPDLRAMFDAAKAEGYDLIIGSGFRDYNLQNFYYSNYVNNYGQTAADTFSAKPGYSEHQTGLVTDLATRDQNCYLQECFGETPAGKWLADNAHRYGFILRYPNGKEAITGYVYEPWHFRYVGKDLAEAIYKSGLTFDEASEYLVNKAN